MPAPVLDKARELRSRVQDVDMEAVLTKLNDQVKQMDEEQALLEEKLAAVKRHEEDLRREKEKIASRRQDIVEAGRREATELKRNLRLEAERIIRELKQQSAEDSARERAKAIDKARRAIQQISLPRYGRSETRSRRSEATQNGPDGLHQFARRSRHGGRNKGQAAYRFGAGNDRCLLYTSDAADE